MKVLELYCGIGGMHFALKSSTLRDKFEVILALDLNPICTEIYGKNFLKTKVVTGNVSSFTAVDINSLSPDMILMSPPCQPFTRLGKQKDINDARNSSFLQFIELIPELTTISYILIENVKGFETSKTRERLLTLLSNCNFCCEEYLLNPYQFGICNSRLRYYLLAKKCEVVINQLINYDLPTEGINAEADASYQVPKKISEILEYRPGSEEWNSYLIPEKMLKHFPVMDIITLDSDTSCCFTHGYTRFCRGTGSVLSAISRDELENMNFVLMKAGMGAENELDVINSIKKLKLRFFTPKEIARLMSFPDTFFFPDHITRKQRYKVLSNSINIYVVSLLISHLTCHNFVST